jgi:hypothetical protein
MSIREGWYEVIMQVLRVCNVLLVWCGIEEKGAWLRSRGSNKTRGGHQSSPREVMPELSSSSRKYKKEKKKQ